MATRSRSLTRLYSALKNAPSNVASLEFNPSTGAWKAVFRDAPVIAAKPVAAQDKPVSLVPGTPFPDDGSPINPLDLVLVAPPIDRTEAV